MHAENTSRRVVRPSGNHSERTAWFARPDSHKWKPAFIFECIVYQFHRSLLMKLIDLRARQIERVGRVGRACLIEMPVT